MDGNDLPKVAPSPVSAFSVTPLPEVIQSGPPPAPVKRQKTEDGQEDEEDEEDDDARDTQGRTITEKGAEIDRASAGFIRLTARERTADSEEADEFGYTLSKFVKNLN